jgi:hypothetical protein
MPDLAWHAQQLARGGWAVFPVEAGGKRPLTPHGCLEATTDPYAIATWWTRWPDANIGVHCGPASGVVALDVDGKGNVDGFAALAELEEEFEPLPLTVMSVTPSGGKHYLFTEPGVPLRNQAGLKRHLDGARRVYRGLDFRAGGGFIVVPPSSYGGREYRWIRDPEFADVAALPGWLLQILTSSPTPRPATACSLAGLLKPDSYVLAAINGECRAVAETKPGERNDRLFRASARLGEFVGAGRLTRAVAEGALAKAAEECGLPDDDAGWAGVHATIASGLDRTLKNSRGRP